MARAFCGECVGTVRTVVFFVCALALLTFADTASANWSSSMTVTAAGAQYSFGQDVGSDGRGAVVWSAPTEGGSGYAIFKRGVSKAGSLGTRLEISQAPPEAFYSTAYHPAIRYAADGTATIVWLQSSYSSESCFAESEEEGGGEEDECEVDEYVKARQIAPDGTLVSQTHDLYHRHAIYPAGGPFGASSPAYVAYGQPAMAPGPGETTTVAWPQSAFAEGCQGYAYSYSYADGGCEAEETIQWVRLNSSGEAEGEPETAFNSETSGYSSAQPLLRMRIGAASDGTATVLFSARIKTEESECWGGQSAIKVVQIGTGGETSAAQELDSGCGSIDPRLVVQSDGTAVAAWSWGGTYSTDEALFARIASDGTPGEAEALLGEYTETRISGLDLARGLAGSTVAVWAEDGTINSREIPPSGSPESVRTVATPAEGGYLSNPRIGLAPDGTGAVAWEAQVSEGGYATGLQGTELAADGTPGNVRTLLSANRWDHGARVSAGGDGSVMASWRVTVPHENKIQAVRLSTEATTSNDDFAEAQVVDPELPSFAAGSNEGASKETEEPNHAGDSGGASVWYSWTAEDSGPVAISTCASGSLDTLLGVYTGTAVNELSEVASADSGAASRCSAGDSEVRFEATSGTTYAIAVDGKGNAEGSFGLKIKARDHVPANDDFVSAWTIPNTPWWTIATNADASRQAGEPEIAGNPGGASVWYSWTPSSSGEIVVSVCGFDLRHPIVGVYTGTAVDGLTDVASDDGSESNCSEGGSRARVQVTGGTTYHIAVDGRNGHEGVFQMQLREVPANDDFVDAEPLYAGLPTSAYGSNEFATRQSGEPEIAGNPGGASVWYSWTPSSSGDVLMSACSYGSLHPLLGVYTGSAIDGLTEVDSADGNGTAECSSNGSKVRLHVTAGTMYRIAIDGRDGQQGSFELRVVQPATNDDFDQAEVLGSSPPTSTYGSNYGASKQSGEPEIAGNPGGASVWYSWTPTSSGVAFVSACIGVSKNTLLGVYTGSSFASLSEVGADVGGGSSGCYGHKGSEVQFEYASGTTYYIALDGEDGAQASFGMSLEALPANDDFENAQAISSSLPEHIYSSNRHATRQAEEPEIEGNSGGASLWYTWTPTSSGRAIFSACMYAGKSALLGIYKSPALGESSGDSAAVEYGEEALGLGSLIQLAAAAGNGSGSSCSTKESEAELEFAPGITYYIALDGEDGTEASFELAIETQTTGSISGTVASAATHEAMPNVSVCAYSSDGGEHAGCASTGSAGKYTISRLPPGEYKVEFDPGYESPYVRQYYDGKESWEEADPVSVSLGETTTGIDAELALGGQITGTVTDALSHEPIEGAEACASKNTPPTTATAPTAAKKATTRSRACRRANTRSSSTRRYESGYVPQYFDGKESPEEADPVAVSLSETTTGIDAELALGGQITGTVTDALSHEPLEGAAACAYELASEEFGGCAYTGEEGHYTIKGLPAGEYRVRFDPSYESAYVPSTTTARKTSKKPTRSRSTWAKPPRRSMPNWRLGGQITGTVTDALSHEPIEGVEVCARGASTRLFGGIRQVHLHRRRRPLHDQRPANGRIQGRVLRPLRRIRLPHPVLRRQGKLGRSRTGRRSALSETTSEIDAALQPELRPDSRHGHRCLEPRTDRRGPCLRLRVRLGANTAAAPTPAEKATMRSAACRPANTRSSSTRPTNRITCASTTTARKAGKKPTRPRSAWAKRPPRLTPNLRLAGRLPAPSQTPRPTNRSKGQMPAPTTSALGKVAAACPPMPKATTRSKACRRANTGSGSTLPMNPSISPSTTTARKAGESRPGLGQPRRNDGGESMPNLWPEVGSPARSPTPEPRSDRRRPCLRLRIQLREYGGCAYTGEEGHYVIGGLPAGDYKVEFNAPYGGYAYPTQYYDGKEGWGEADSVSVSLGETTTGIDAALQPSSGQIAGTVTDALSHEPIEDVHVCTYTGHASYYGHCAYSGEEGQYVIGGLPAGEYEVRFDPPHESSDLPQYYDGKESLEEADSVSVSVGETTSAIDAALEAGGQIAGTITDASTHEPIEGAEACTYTEHASYYGHCAYTGEEGHYTIKGLPAGEYEVRFDPPYESPYVPRYFDGKESLEDADAISVGLGETTSAINAELAVGGQIAGTVTDASTHEPIGGAEVCAYEFISGGYGSCASTGEEGHYVISGLPAGEYRVEFWAPSGEYDYLVQYYDGKESWEEADPVSVSLGETTSAIDAALEVSSGQISSTAHRRLDPRTEPRGLCLRPRGRRQLQLRLHRRRRPLRNQRPAGRRIQSPVQPAPRIWLRAPVFRRQGRPRRRRPGSGQPGRNHHGDRCRTRARRADCRHGHRRGQPRTDRRGQSLRRRTSSKQPLLLRLLLLRSQMRLHRRRRPLRNQRPAGRRIQSPVQPALRRIRLPHPVLQRQGKLRRSRPGLRHPGRSHRRDRCRTCGRRADNRRGHRHPEPRTDRRGRSLRLRVCLRSIRGLRQHRRKRSLHDQRPAGRRI